MTPRTINRVCTIATRTAGDADRYGDPQNETIETETVCYIEQRQTSEQTGELNVGSEDWLGLFPAGTGITESDAVTVDGDTYEVDGPPWPVYNPRLRRVVHIEAALKRTPA